MNRRRGQILAILSPGGLSWRADRQSWLTRSVFGVNVLLLAGLAWLLNALR